MYNIIIQNNPIFLSWYAYICNIIYVLHPSSNDEMSDLQFALTTRTTTRRICRGTRPTLEPKLNWTRECIEVGNRFEIAAHPRTDRKSSYWFVSGPPLNQLLDRTTSNRVSFYLKCIGKSSGMKIISAKSIIIHTISRHDIYICKFSSKIRLILEQSWKLVSPPSKQFFIVTKSSDIKIER